jgi:hypothetical protein
VRRSSRRFGRYVGEDQVQGTPRLGKDLLRHRDLVVAAGLTDSTSGGVDLFDGATQIASAAGVCRDRRERIRHGGPVGPQVLPTGLGEGDEFSTCVGDDRDKVFRFQLGDSGVDRARAWTPGALGTVGDGMHELVPVHGLVGQKDKDCRAYIPALGPITTAAATWAVNVAFV